MNATAEQEAYVKITEIIGEMAWGIELPSPMQVSYLEDGKLMHRMIRPESYEPVFDAIYRRLKMNTEYSPVQIWRDKEEQMNAHIIKLENALIELLEAYDSILPGTAHIPVQDYELLNRAPMNARKLIGRK